MTRNTTGIISTVKLPSPCWPPISWPRWSDSESWLIRLDQGFGYWGTVSETRPEFPFDTDVMRQVGKLRGANLTIEPLHPDYPTYWHCTRT